MAIKSRKPAQNKYIKMLVHSPAGHGKTTLLGSAEEDERTAPMAFLNFEGGDVSLVGLDIDIFDMRDFQDYAEAKRMLRRKDNPYKSVGIDSITETQVAGLLGLLDNDGGVGTRADPDILAQSDWGIMLVRMRRFVRDFKFLPVHTFFTALSKDDVVPRVGQVKIPAVQGSFAAELPGIMDVVSYLALEEDEGETTRLLLLHDYPKFSVKTRTPWGKEVPAEIADPTITKLLDALGY